MTALIIATFLVCAVAVSNARKPILMAATTAPDKPSLVCMYVYVPGPLSRGAKPIEKT